ncbi:hypothetical protein TVAG_186370 [Trichomonas vaginalis G3]|uniref:Uncharacterized protein n=1 Tax=Trichomonas vaginalis (strain ATCC PRA-98 / G3) TaxID=412133 RepID=A2D8T0_TRIV3|nr:hypothetical protein TVAGG3_0387990 [Trichomonas vaginalis G3]EAY23329.1 hypothetical protein TVAG_186370 [Trichomonas vaginalis G3]KAI5533792.1 hypothetical protein TVAGG3_0387990 [Trichomonas vaginalis G3]|eukprot:XP_001584315.1 hypothetical protein [Trichomonas vaginalis G3]
MSESNEERRKNEFPRDSLVFRSQVSVLDFDKEDDPETYGGMAMERIYKNLENFLLNGSIPNSNEQKTVIRYLQHKNVEAISNGDYKEAGKFEDLKKKFSDACVVFETKKAIRNETISIKNDISDLKLQLEIIEKQYQEKIDKAKEKDKQEIDRLKRCHEDELKQFNIYWSNPENTLEFAKSSAELNGLRKKQKLLLIVKEFEAAEAVRAEARKLERKESNDANKAIRQAMETKREALEQKFEAELLRVRQHSIKIVEELKIQQAKEEAILIARIKKLENDKGNISVAPRNRDKTPDNVISPRSRAVMSTFKNSTAPKRLMLKPLSPATLKPSRLQILTKSNETFG